MARRRRPSTTQWPRTLRRGHARSLARLRGHARAAFMPIYHVTVWAMAPVRPSSPPESERSETVGIVDSIRERVLSWAVCLLILGALAAAATAPSWVEPAIMSVTARLTAPKPPPRPLTPEAVKAIHERDWTAPIPGPPRPGVGPRLLSPLRPEGE